MRYGQAQTVGPQNRRMRKKLARIYGLLLIVAATPLLSVLTGCAGVVTSAKQTSSTASFQLNPASVNFGQVVVGKQVTQKVSVSNTGNVGINITQVTVSNGHFSVSGMTPPMALAVGQTGSFAVAVDPTATGNLAGTLTATGDSGSAPVTVSLSATVVNSQSQLTVSPTAINFGNVTAGSKGTSNLVLTNTGTTSVTVSLLTLTGADFTLSGITTPKTIAAGQSAQVTVTFAPTAAGSATGSLSITSTDSTNPTVSVPLSGTGTTAQAGLSVSPTSFNFGSVVDGQTKSQAITVSNTGTAAVTIAQFSVSGNAFSVSGLSTPATIAAGSSATFSVLFAPTTAGSLAGSVSIASNAANSPNVVSLSGSGTAASITLSSNPTSLSFGSVNAGSTSSKSVTITNSGNTSVTISQVSVNATDVAESGLAAPVTLSAGQTATMSVVFSPKKAENITGNITLASSQGTSAVIPVSGTGVQAGLTITPTSAGFGNVTIGSPATQTIQLANSGTGTLTITQVSVAGSGFSVGTLALPLSINPGQASNFNVQFAPAAAGSVTGSVTIVSNAPNSPAVVGLSGTGVAASLALTFSTTSLSFGSVNTGTSSTKNVTVTNSGNSGVTVSQISASGTGFTLTGASAPVTLSVGQSLTFGVVFSPTVAGTDTGTVTVTSTAAGSPATITLSGSGVQATTHSVALAWTASTSTVTGYNVYRSTVNGSSYTKVNSGLIGGVTYSDTSVQSGTTYFYVVTAVDSSGTESTYSNQATAVIP